jgi:hypothetical protein
MATPTRGGAQFAGSFVLKAKLIRATSLRRYTDKTSKVTRSSPADRSSPVSGRFRAAKADTAGCDVLHRRCRLLPIRRRPQLIKLLSCIR